MMDEILDLIDELHADYDDPRVTIKRTAVSDIYEFSVTVVHEGELYRSEFQFSRLLMPVLHKEDIKLPAVSIKRYIKEHHDG